MSSQNIVMDEELVKNSVMNAKIDPKVVMDLSTYKIVDGMIYSPAIKIKWRILRMRLNRRC